VPLAQQDTHEFLMFRFHKRKAFYAQSAALMTRRQLCYSSWIQWQAARAL